MATDKSPNQTSSLYSIIDANINRISEGLRVIEEFTRFIVLEKGLTMQISSLRKRVNASETSNLENLKSRNTAHDMRFGEKPQKRQNITSLLKANFKRVEEGLRVLEEYTGNSDYSAMRYEAYMLEKNVLLLAHKPIIKNGIYVISDDIDVLEKSVQEGASLIQLRDKFATKRSILRRAEILKKRLGDSDVPFIINDFIDIALKIDADGLHIGQDDLDVDEIRPLLGPHKIIGKTTHSLQEGLHAEKTGADYVSVGPIWETPSKEGRSGIGFDYLKAANDQLRIPYVAIGGIDLKRAADLAPFDPPLIGVIRAYTDIQKLKKFVKNGEH